MRAALKGVTIGLILSGVSFWVASGQPQQSQSPVMVPMGPIHPLGRDEPLPGGDINSQMKEQQAQARNRDRQKRIVTDTDKMVDLARQLKEQVTAPGKAATPGDAGKKAEEIEKLAKGVKDRMKG